MKAFTSNGLYRKATGKSTNTPVDKCAGKHLNKQTNKKDQQIKALTSAKVFIYKQAKSLHAKMQTHHIRKHTQYTFIA